MTKVTIDSNQFLISGSCRYVMKSDLMPVINCVGGCSLECRSRREYRWHMSHFAVVFVAEWFVYKWRGFVAGCNELPASLQDTIDINAACRVVIVVVCGSYYE